MNVTTLKARNIDLIFAAPPSKSYTHRALIAAALAKGKSTIFRPLDAEVQVIPRVHGSAIFQRPMRCTAAMTSSGTPISLLKASPPVWNWPAPPSRPAAPAPWCSTRPMKWPWPPF